MTAPQNPPVPMVFNAVSRTLEDISKNSHDLAGPLRAVTFLSMYMAQNFDTCVSDRLQEIAALRGLLARGAAIAPLPLRNALEEIRKIPDDQSDFRVSALEERLEKLRAALIELQAWLEEPTQSQYSNLLDDIWAFLCQNAKSHRNLMEHLY